LYYFEAIFFRLTVDSAGTDAVEFTGRHFLYSLKEIEQGELVLRLCSIVCNEVAILMSLSVLGNQWVLIEGLQDLTANVGDLDDVDLWILNYRGWLFSVALGCWLCYLLSLYLFCFVAIG